MIVKHEVVLEKAELQYSERFIHFCAFDEDGQVVESHYVPAGLWFDMEMPETITVAVFPKDTLNNLADQLDIRTSTEGSKNTP